MKRLLFTLLTIFIWQIGFAYIAEPTKKKKRKKTVTSEISLRETCDQPTDKFFQSINNVRAILTTGGDTWTENSVGTYIVPRKENAEDEVSALYSGAVWIGGKDPGDNIKMMISGHRQSSEFDIFAGPLDLGDGSTEKAICEKWDKHFKVLGRDIDQHIAAYKLNPDLNCDLIPDGIKYWPAKGNPYFYDKYKFKLPVGHDLAPFFDQNEDNIYDPCDGDYPTIHIEGPEGKGECPPGVYADEMFFWVYNDAGGTHTKSHAKAIQMEVQVEAFAWATNDEVNDMTFQRYKLINRAASDIKECTFAWWVDPDLGCSDDDYIGCVPPPVNLMFVYNMDELDGDPGCSCDRGVNTYCDKVPMIGVDYFRGPSAHFKITEEGDTIPIGVDEDGDITKELGMTSFIYYIRGEGVNRAMADPTTVEGFYNYLNGRWNDGTPLTKGGSGYNPGSTDFTNFAFDDAPNDPNGWSMYTEAFPKGDMRTIQSTGQFVLKPGDVNELIIGVPWVPNIVYPGPSLDAILAADELAQSLFDNCFKLQDGPDAPTVDIVELDKELVLVLYNDSLTSNNANENFHEVGLKIDKDRTDDYEYRFEGYKVYQLYNGDVSAQELDNFEKARLVYQSDLRNGIETLYNWKSITNPSVNGSSERIFIPTKKVVGKNKGLKHVIRIVEDQFGQESKGLINHRPYYFMAVAYESNNWQEFNPNSGEGQREPYFEGRRNVKIYKAVPRPIEYTKLNVNPLEGPSITTKDGFGIGNRFVEITQETEDKILENNFVEEITYKPGSGPVAVEVYSPFEVKNNEYKLELYDNDMSDDKLDLTSYWNLTNLSSNSKVKSDTLLTVINEQVIQGDGFSVSMYQVPKPFETRDEVNGIIGSKLIYSDPNKVNWLGIVKDDAGINISGVVDNQFRTWDITNYVLTRKGEEDHARDPENALANNLREVPFVPFMLTRYGTSDEFFVTPGARDYLKKVRKISYFLKDYWADSLNNVDIVFTSDKSKWSRCIVVEESYKDMYEELLGELDGIVGPEGDAENFQLRQGASVGKDDNDGDGLADPDNDGVGMSWFPGYAIDVVTGERLNIFFGEASVYGGNEDIDAVFRKGKATGRDMMFNPTSDALVNFPFEVDLPISYSWRWPMGGMHAIYVTNERYDGCAGLRKELENKISSTLKMKKALDNITWTSLILLNPLDSTIEFLPYKDGLIPNDVRVQLRVNSPYAVPEKSFLKRGRNGYGEYTFNFDGMYAGTADELGKENALDGVNVVPNPYYAYSEYETSQFNKQVKITNLPGKCEITIYSIDGKFIRKYSKEEIGLDYNIKGQTKGLEKQIYPDVVWDLKNHKGIPVASGVYLIHIVSDELGAERTIKWFGINRQFDPSGL